MGTVQPRKREGVGKVAVDCWRVRFVTPPPSLVCFCCVCGVCPLVRSVCFACPGDNACSQHSWSCCPYGFGAAEGFDAVSGVGTPNFSKLRDQL